MRKLIIDDHPIYLLSHPLTSGSCWDRGLICIILIKNTCFHKHKYVNHSFPHNRFATVQVQWWASG